MSLFRNKQTVSDLHDANAYQSQGNMTVYNQGVNYPELRQMVIDIVRSEMFQLSQQAETKIMELALKYEEKLVGILAKNEEDTLIPKFQSPGIQFVMRDSLKEYVKEGSDECLEQQVDMLIDRLKIDEDSVKKPVIEEAISVLPKLSKKAAALLAAMWLRNLTVNTDTMGLIHHLQTRANLYKMLEGISPLDIAYLRQVNCCNLIVAARHYIPYERLLINRNNMLFRHYGDENELGNLLGEYGLLDFKINGNALFIRYKSDEVLPAIPRLSMLEEKCKEQNNEHSFGQFKKLVESRPEYTEEEVRSFIIAEAPEWRIAFDTLNHENVQHLEITPLGAYIAKKVLKRVTGVDSPDISESFNNNR